MKSFTKTRMQVALLKGLQHSQVSNNLRTSMTRYFYASLTCMFQMDTVVDIGPACISSCATVYQVRQHNLYINSFSILAQKYSTILLDKFGSKWRCSVFLYYRRPPISFLCKFGQKIKIVSLRGNLLPKPTFFALNQKQTFQANSVQIIVWSKLKFGIQTN